MPKKHNRKRKNRRQSFVAAEDTVAASPSGRENQATSSHASLFMLGRRKKSSDSLDSEALLDHRNAEPLQARRPSIQSGNTWLNSSKSRLNLHRDSIQNASSRLTQSATFAENDIDDNTPLLSASYFPNNARAPPTRSPVGYSSNGIASSSNMLGGIWRGHSRDSSPASNRQRLSLELHHNSSRGNIAEYDVNNPPSMPGSPLLEGLDDVMLSEETRGETLIDIDQHSDPGMGTSTSPLATPGGLKRRSTLPAPHDDVCFPQDVLSEIAEEEETSLRLDIEQTRPRRRRHKQWPDLETLEAWSAEERDRRAVEGNVRAVHVREPQLVDGRLRPRKIDWHRDAEDAPFRFTYFNEDFDNTIHSQTISELLKPGQKFQDLFIPEAPIIDEDSSDDDGSNIAPSELDRKFSGILSNPGLFKTESGRPPQNKSGPGTTDSSGTPTGRVTPTQFITSPQPKTATRGPRPAFWLDVLSPTDAEMRLLSKVFAIHPLTTEDILIQEEREKVELFRNYYFVSYRSYEQDVNSEDYLSPVNMYVVVFREGILSFHFSQTPHPANVRRRIRQLSDYLFLTTDWISYAIIDDVTDAYAPLIQRIEEEVDDIDQQILDLNDSDSDSDNEDSSPIKRSARSLKDKIFGGVFRRRRSIDYSAVSEKDPNMGQKKSQRDVLRQIGDSRKKVMSLYRLLVTKADVVKGFAKRCNEQWEVAPRSEIGLYLGDIQDHIVTMTGNLNYYENILSRAQSNYLAQMNIRMTERAEKTNDVLGKLTVLGTIVLPMNIVTGLFGMNTRVPGEDGEPGDLNWFWAITGGLLLSGLICFFIARRSFGVV